jgi:hypothetical protein
MAFVGPMVRTSAFGFPISRLCLVPCLLQGHFSPCRTQDKPPAVRPGAVCMTI